MAASECTLDEEQSSIHLASTVEHHLEDARKRLIEAERKAEWFRDEIDLVVAKIEAKEAEKERLERQPVQQTDDTELTRLEKELRDKESLVFKCQQEVAEICRSHRETLGAKEDAERETEEAYLQMESQLQIYKEMLGELEDKITEHKEDSEGQASKRKEKIRKICQAIDKTAREHQRCKAQLERAEEEECNLLREAENHESQLKELKPLIGAAEKARSEAQQQARRKEDQVQEMRRKHGMLEADVKRLCDETAAAAAELEQVTLDEKSSSKERMRLEGEVAKLQATVSALQKNNAAINAKVALLEKRKQDKEVEQSMLNKKHKERAAVQSNLAGTLQALQTELTHAGVIAEAAEADARQVQQQAEEAQQGEKELRKKAESMLVDASQQKQFYEAVEEANQKYSDAKARLLQASTEVERLGVDIQACKDKLAKVQVQRTRLERSVVELREKNDKQISHKHRFVEAKRAESEYIWNKLEEALHLSPTRTKGDLTRGRERIRTPRG